MKAILRISTIMILCAAQAALADTRISVSGGISGVNQKGNPLNWMSWHAQAAVDAPSVIRRHIPLELVLVAEAPYENAVIVDDDGVGRRAWDRAFGTEEILRIYAHGQNYPIEPGVGVGCYQFWPYQNVWNGGNGMRYERLPIQTQWRWHAFLRVNFSPSHNSGPLLEAELQRAFSDSGIFDQPVGAAILKLGWRFHV
jgi:hypothetical protein